MTNQESSQCIFCRIVAGDANAFRVYEDEEYLGFLDIFPNTEAFSIIIPKSHCLSDFALVSPAVLAGLMNAARTLALKITVAYEDVARCAVVIEGMMIDHLHAKVIPLHQTVGKSPSVKEDVTARSKQYFAAYPGYITTQIAIQMADSVELARIAAKINRSDKSVQLDDDQF